MTLDPHTTLSDHARRIATLEEQVKQLTALVITPIALTHETSSLSDAEQLVLEHLPVVEEKEEETVEETSRRGDETQYGHPTSMAPPDSPHGGNFDDLVESGRNVSSARATTTLPRPLSRNFRPSEFGYTTEDFSRDYPDVNPVIVLESFFNHHMAKGDVSRNWLEKFWQYAKIANEMEKERKMSNPTETDSMGLPTDRKARRGMLGQD